MDFMFKYNAKLWITTKVKTPRSTHASVIIIIISYTLIWSDPFYFWYFKYWLTSHIYIYITINLQFTISLYISNIISIYMVQVNRVVGPFNTIFNIGDIFIYVNYGNVILRCRNLSRQMSSWKLQNCKAELGVREWNDVWIGWKWKKRERVQWSELGHQGRVGKDDEKQKKEGERGIKKRSGLLTAAVTALCYCLRLKGWLRFFFLLWLLFCMSWY